MTNEGGAAVLAGRGVDPGLDRELGVGALGEKSMFGMPEALLSLSTATLSLVTPFMPKPVAVSGLAGLKPGTAIGDVRVEAVVAADVVVGRGGIGRLIQTPESQRMVVQTCAP